MAGTAVFVSLDEFAKHCQELGKDLASLSFRKPLEECRVLIVAATRANFDMGQDPDGVVWLPLKRPRNRARDRRAKGGSGQKPLRDTGALMASVVASGTGHIDVLTDFSLVVGTNLQTPEGFPYPAVHQFGSLRVPARPFLGIGKKQETQIGEIFGDYMAKVLE